MESGLLDTIRRSCQIVASRARHVRIAQDRIHEYSLSLLNLHVPEPEHDPGCHYLNHGAGTAAFFLTLDSVNFGSGYFPHLKKRPGKSGYFTIAGSLNDYFIHHGPLSTDELTQISPDDCIRIFGQDSDNQPVRELMTHFSRAWNDLGRYISKRFDVKLINLIESADSSAERLVQLLSEMPYFNDVEPYHDMNVPFYKRAQITAADLMTAFSGKGIGCFHDTERLTIFADNLVPHVLRVDGILQYTDELSARIDAQELIPAFSEEEVEIRACAVHAVECIKEELIPSGHHIKSMELDYLLWNRGQQPYYKARPRHRTRTVYY